MYYVSTLVGLVITNSLTSTLPTITRSLSSWTVQLTEWAQILFVHLLLLKCSTFEMGHRIRPVHTSLQIFSACNRQSLCKIGEFSSFFVLNALHHYKFAATSDWLVWSLNHRHLIKRTEYSFWKCSLNSFSLRESANELESLHWIWISRSNLLIHL